MATATCDPMTTADIADRFGVSGHVARVVCDRLELGYRIRRYRVIPAEHLPEIRAALIGGGYIRAEEHQPIGA